jgi:TetR/AcrR family fatty acid metabolism transcriptional regulator
MNLKSREHSETAGRREREKLRRAQDILSAAERVFAIHGFDAATIEQIAQEAEYAAGTIYLYFKDKHALYAALIASKLSSMVDQVEKAAQEAAPADPANRLRNAIKAQFEFHDHNREFFEVLMRHHKEPPPAGTRDWKLIEQTLKRHHTILVSLIEQSQRRKLIRQGSSTDFATALVGMVVHLTRFAMKDGQQPLAAKTDFVFQLFMTGAQRAR